MERSLSQLSAQFSACFSDLLKQQDKLAGQVSTAGEFLVAGQGGRCGNGIHAITVAERIGLHDEIHIRIIDQGRKMGHGFELRH